MNAPGLWLLSRAAFQAAMSSGRDQGSASLAAPTPMASPREAPANPPSFERPSPGPDRLPLPRPATLFRPVSPNPYHLSAAQVNSANFDEYMKGIAAALGGAVERWARLAVLVNVRLDGAVASGGRLHGPPLYPLLIRDAPRRTLQQQRYSRAIALAVSAAWDGWAQGCRVPELPWYPAFASLESGAPPMVNLPVPLLLLESTAADALTPELLAAAMRRNLADPRAYHQAVLFHALATGIATAFVAWKASTLVTNVRATRRMAAGGLTGTGTMAVGGLRSPPSQAALARRAGPDDAPEFEAQARSLEQKAADAPRLAAEARQNLQACAPAPGR